ncbi:MAG: VOC family protein [Dehalococcoidia bacterium]|nr:VOC family protein [Dehalococcoidia bacterium]
MKIPVSDIFHVGLTVSHVDWHKDFLIECLGMGVLSDSKREGNWISEVTGLPDFKARNVYVTPDGTNRLEMFEILYPPLVDLPISLGTDLGVSHVRIRAKDIYRVRGMIQERGLSIVEAPPMNRQETLMFQDASGLFWEIVPHDSENYTIQVVVSDLDASMELYSGLLGFEPLLRFDGTALIQDSPGHFLPANAQMQRIASPCNQFIDLCQYSHFRPLKNPRSTINCMGFHHIAFRVADALDAFGRIKAKGYRYISEPINIPEGPNRGGILFYFYDGDGTVLEILQPPATNSISPR